MAERPARAPVERCVASASSGLAQRIPATLSDGTTLDLLANGPADDSDERYSDPLYSRWTKITERIATGAYTDYRL